jgi:TP901 family phage tail tape measure protein
VGAELFTLFGRITTNATAAMAELGAVTGAAGKAGAAMTKSLGQVGGAMTGIIGPLGLMGMGLGFAALARSGVQNITAINRAASEFQMATGASKEEADAFRESLESLHRQHVDTWEEIAHTMNVVRQRYRETGEEAKATTNLFLDWADATGEAAAGAVETLSAILMGFDRPLAETARLMDMLKAASQATGRPVSELTDALTMSSGAMKAANITYEDGIALLAAIQSRGVPAGVAVRSLTMFLNLMTQPTKASTAALKMLGIEVDGLGKPIGGAKQALLEIADALKKAPDNVNLFAAALDLFGGPRFGGQFIRGLRAGTEGVEQMSAALGRSEGAVKRAADLFDQQLGNRLTLLRRNVLDPIANDLGRVIVGALESFGGRLRDSKGEIDQEAAAMARIRLEAGLLGLAMFALVSRFGGVITTGRVLLAFLAGPGGLVLALAAVTAALWAAVAGANAWRDAQTEAGAAARFLSPEAQLPIYKERAQALQRLTAAQREYNQAQKLERSPFEFGISAPEMLRLAKAKRDLAAAQEAYNAALKKQPGAPGAPVPPGGGGGAAVGGAGGGAAAAEKKSAADLAQERIRELAAEYQLAEAQDVKLAKAIAYYTAVIAFVKRYRDSTVLAEKEAAAAFQEQRDKANEATGSWGEFMDGLAKSAKGAGADITGFYNSLRSQMEQLRGASPAEEIYKARAALAEAIPGTEAYAAAVTRVAAAEEEWARASRERRAATDTETAEKTAADIDRLIGSMREEASVADQIAGNLDRGADSSGRQERSQQRRLDFLRRERDTLLDLREVYASMPAVVDLINERLRQNQNETNILASETRTWLDDMRDNAIPGVARAFEDFFTGLSQGAINFGNLFQGILQAIIQALIQIEAREAAAGILGALGLQHGGIVTRPTLALIGEAGPEAVVPLGAGGAAGLHDLQASLLAKLWGGPRGEQQQNVYLEDGAIRLELSLDSLSPWDMYRAADRLADPFSRILMRRLATLPSY